MTNDLTGAPPGSGAGVQEIEQLKQRQSYVDKQLQQAADMLRSVSDEIRRECDAVLSGDQDARALSKLTRSDWLGLARLMMETEEKLNGQISGRAGRAGAHAIDLGQARADIGRRLSRLRTAGGSTRVSEGPEPE